MSQFNIEYIGIEDITRDSKTILILEKTKEKKELDKITAMKFKVIEILFNRSKAKQIKEEIFVKPANSGLIKAMSEHLAKHGHQGMPSPIVKGYKTSLVGDKFDKASRLIAFLITTDENGEIFEFLCENSYESLTIKKEVTKLIIELNKDKY